MLCPCLKQPNSTMTGSLICKTFPDLFIFQIDNVLTGLWAAAHAGSHLTVHLLAKQR